MVGLVEAPKNNSYELGPTIIESMNGVDEHHPNGRINGGLLVDAVEESKKSRIKECLVLFTCEFIGSAILLFSGCLTTVQLWNIEAPLSGGIGFGFTVCMIISIFGPISGAHVNPAVTLCACLYGSIPYWMFFVYLPAQILGGLAGFGLIAASMPWNIYLEKINGGLCMTLPHDDMEIYTAIIFEFFLTSVLILVCCGLWDKRAEKLQDSGAIKFALAVAGLSIAGGNLTGASMNPIRSLAPAVWNNNFTAHWIYWLAPLSSSFCTTLFYQYFLRSK